MLIIEGPDNSGKTTLAQKIAAQTGWEYRRPPALSSTDGVSDGVFQWWEAELNRPPRERHITVYDRCTYISDPIYRLVTAQEPLRDETAMRVGITRLIDLGASIVFCQPSWEWSLPFHLAERAEGGGLKNTTLEQMRVIHWAYVCSFALWKEANFDTVTHYDPSAPDEWDRFVKHFLTPHQNYIARRMSNG